MENYTHILWDFNGTILDDVAIGVDSVNIMLTKRGVPALSREKYREIFDFPVVEYYRRAGFDMQKEPFEILAHEWVAEYNQRRHMASVYPGVKEAMLALRARGLCQVVLSASRKQMLLEQLEELDVTRYVDEIYGTQDIYANGKESVALMWREKNPAARTLVVGDTTHDAEIARLIGAEVALFDGGHMSRARLTPFSPFIFSDFKDLMRFTEKHAPCHNVET